MVFEEPDEGPGFRRPPSFDDRLWRHPSELGRLEPGTLDPPIASPSTGFRRISPVWLAALTSALGASLVTAGVVMVFLGQRPPASDAASNGAEAAAIATSLSLPDTASEPVVAVTQRIRPTVVKLRARQAGVDQFSSAVIIDSDGHAVTNAAGVAAASTLEAELSDGTVVPARLVGTDPVTDTAVVKLDGSGYPVAPIGSTSELQVGQLTMVIGSPADGTGQVAVAMGVVSALDQTVVTGDGRVLREMIQTDSRMPDGVLGGAVVDGSGSVIGIATSAVDASGVHLSLVLPIEVVESVASQLMEWGQVARSWLGVETRDLDDTLARSLDLDGGALVVSAEEDGPAASAGLAPGDVVVEFGGDQVDSAADLVATVGHHGPGETVTVGFLRDGEGQHTQVTLGQRSGPG